MTVLTWPEIFQNAKHEVIKAFNCTFFFNLVNQLMKDKHFIRMLSPLDLFADICKCQYTNVFIK